MRVLETGSGSLPIDDKTETSVTSSIAGRKVHRIVKNRPNRRFRRQTTRRWLVNLKQSPPSIPVENKPVLLASGEPIYYFVVTMPYITARYSSNLSNEARQVAITQVRPKVSLSLSITNEAGQSIDRIEVGQSLRWMLYW